MVWQANWRIVWRMYPGGLAAFKSLILRKIYCFHTVDDDVLGTSFGGLFGGCG